MLNKLGYESLDALVDAAVPPGILADARLIYLLHLPSMRRKHGFAS